MVLCLASTAQVRRMWLHCSVFLAARFADMQAHGHPAPKMNQHMAVKHPDAWIVGQESQNDMSPSRDTHSISSQGRLQVQASGGCVLPEGVVAAQLPRPSSR